jgi:hypothetical protein
VGFYINLNLKIHCVRWICRQVGPRSVVEMLQYTSTDNEISHFAEKNRESKKITLRMN